jgi:hypothetical protein
VRFRTTSRLAQQLFQHIVNSAGTIIDRAHAQADKSRYTHHVGFCFDVVKHLVFYAEMDVAFVTRRIEIGKMRLLQREV